ncbi:hypothetical protein WJX73_002310 [Symbiochloris irregularis]|uniref:DET1- and DDB1-associated protein 1 domain-containing protein n=1 Tax=Symbiochloris irregularis TaxID=706552 RepID=A0AAW1NXJ5_9CHLO
MAKDLRTLLSDLPSRGNFAGSDLQSTRAKSYVCAHDSRPPLHQRLQSDQQPLLIRLLLQKKSKDAEQRRKQQQDREKAAAGKRPASTSVTPATAKRQNTEGQATPTWTLQQLRSKTNAELTQIYRSKGSKPGGKKKEELVQGILDLQH